jgi:NAD(P)H-dependent FMN reductase
MPITAKILVFPGSIRTGAYSGKTADAAARELAVQGALVTRISLADYPLPIMDQDLEREQGVPENAVRLARLLAGHDGVLIATPEYNGSIPPLLKNAIDWVSRVLKDGGEPITPFDGKAAALCSSSVGHFAGIRAINHLRAVLVQLRMEVISPQVSVPQGKDAFDDNGDFREERLRDGMRRLCTTLIERAVMLSVRNEP